MDNGGQQQNNKQIGIRSNSEGPSGKNNNGQ